MVSVPSELAIGEVSPADFPSAVKDALEEFLDERYAEVEKIGPPVTRSVQHLRDFILGGGKLSLIHI